MNEQNQQQTLPPQQTPIPPQNVNPPSALQQRNWIKWVLIIVFIAILSSGATYFVLNSQSQKPPPPQITQTIPSPTPTPDETANWKTYTDSELKFLIKYPNEWGDPIKVAQGDVSSVRFGKYPTYQPDLTIKTYEIAVWIVQADREEPLEQTLKDHPDYTKVEIANMEAYRIPKYGLDVPRINTIVVNKNIRYDIQLNYNSDKYINKDGFEIAQKDFPEAEQVYNQILSTFRFTP